MSKELKNLRRNIAWVTSEKYTKTALAKKAGISRVWLSKLVNPEGPTPSIEIVLALSKALKVSLDDMVASSKTFREAVK